MTETGNEIVKISGFRTVFDRASFHQQHEAFFDKQKGKDLEATLAELERQMKGGTIHPSYLYNQINQIIESQDLEKTGKYIVYGGASIFGLLWGVAGYAIGDTVSTNPVIKGGIALFATIIAGGGTVLTLQPHLQKNTVSIGIRKRVEEELRDKYKVGTYDQIYPPKQEEERANTYKISYEREIEWNHSSSMLTVLKEEHSLVVEENETVKVVVENGVPKKVLVYKRGSPIQYWDFSRTETEKAPFPSPIEVPSDALQAYQKRVQRYVVFD